jgi:hypothetical protein
MQQNTTGNANAVPETEKIQFTTPQEMEKYEGMLDQKFVKLGNNGEPDPKLKNYFFQIVSMHPSQPAGMLGEGSFMEFGIQKFDKTKVRVEEKNGIKVRIPEPVRARDDNGRCVDDHADFFIDAKQFLKSYQSDTE